jgi:hypothetical protein
MRRNFQNHQSAVSFLTGEATIFSGIGLRQGHGPRSMSIRVSVAAKM